MGYTIIELVVSMAVLATTPWMVEQGMIIWIPEAAMTSSSVEMAVISYM